MKKVGRKLTEIRWEEFDKLCYMQCSLEEISWWFECDTKTIERAVKREFNESFGTVYKWKSARGKISLRRTMFQLAVDDKCEGMLKYLDRKYLGGTPFDAVRQQDVNVVVTSQQIPASPEMTTKILREVLSLPPSEDEKAPVIDIIGTQG